MQVLITVGVVAAAGGTLSGSLTALAGLFTRGVPGPAEAILISITVAAVCAALMVARTREVVVYRLNVLRVVVEDFGSCARSHAPARLALDVLTWVPVERMILMLWRSPGSFFPPEYRPDDQ